MKSVCDDINVGQGETLLLQQAAERIRDMDRALRAHMSNMTVKGLPSFIALSRHQFELASFVNERKGGRTENPVTFLLKDHATGESHPYTMVEREPEREVSEEEREMFDDISWRAHALNGVLDDFQKKLSVNNFGELIELSNHQCELVDYLSTGKFRKAPQRRKARTLGTEGVTPESSERIEALGEALTEYQGRIEIKNLREFIALSKHQCELAGMVADYRWGGPRKSERAEDRMVFNLVHYGEAYPNAVGASEKSVGWVKAGQAVTQHSMDVCEKEREGSVGLRSALGTSCSRQPNLHSDAVNVSDPVGKRPRERGKREEEWLVMSEPEGRVERHPSAARTSGESVSPGVPFCDTFGHAKVSKKPSHPSTTPLSIPDHALLNTKKPQPVIKPAPVKVKTYPVLIEGEVRTGDGALEPHANLQMGIRADRAKQYFNAAADREGKFSHPVEIEASPGGAQRVVVWGKAIDRVYAMPLQFAQVRVKVRSDGFSRTFECEANGNGEFSRTFEREKEDGFP